MNYAKCHAEFKISNERVVNEAKKAHFVLIKYLFIVVYLSFPEVTFVCLVVPGFSRQFVRKYESLRHHSV